MTTTAGVTVPGQRRAYNVTFQISSKDTLNRKMKKARIKCGHSKPKYEDENFHKSWGKTKDYSYVFTGTGDEKPWSKIEKNTNRKLTSQKVKPPLREESQNSYKIKEDGKRIVKKGTLVVTDKYFEAVKDERARLLELLESLQKRNDVLESENKNIVQDFNTIQRENDLLRKKLDTGGEPVLESYKRVYDDRKLLREAENSYKSRIVKLEEELRVTRRNYQKLADELKVQTLKITKKSEELELKGKYNKYYWDCYHLRNENEYLKTSVQSLQRKLSTVSYVQQKSPRTAPTQTTRHTDYFPIITPSPINDPYDTYGQTVNYLTLPEIESQRETDRQTETELANPFGAIGDFCRHFQKD